MVSIVTVNYKTKAYVERMLASLFEHNTRCSFEVFVVENGSGDDLSDLAKQFPSVRFIKSETNLGFAGGCNLAIRQATGDILLVNPDIVFDTDAVCQLEERMQRDTDVGVGGISLKNLDGTQQPCVWRFPKPLDQLLLLLKIPHVLPNVGPVRRWLMKDFDYARTADVDQVMGAFFYVRRKVIDEIGMLDDGFFMWYEEVDFCKRTKDAGWKVRYYADVSARHKKGSSFESVATLRKQAMVRRSLRRFMRKHYGLLAWLLFTIPEPIYVLVALLAAVLKPT